MSEKRRGSGDGVGVAPHCEHNNSQSSAKAIEYPFLYDSMQLATSVTLVIFFFKLQELAMRSIAKVTRPLNCRAPKAQDLFEVHHNDALTVLQSLDSANKARLFAL